MGRRSCRWPAVRYNFDIVRFEYYRDRDVGFEGFSAQSYLFREEFTSRFWATRYDFPAVRDGRVKRDEIPDDTPSGAQGWFINTRRPKFADPRLREALNDAFDFEWTNKTIMYGAYLRTVSVFQNSDMMAVGQARRGRTRSLEPFRGRVPDEVFGEPYTPPVSDGSGQDRALLRKASQLLDDAGCVIKDGKRVLPSGEPIGIEFLIDEPAFEPHHMPFIKNLGTLGDGSRDREQVIAAASQTGVPPEVAEQVIALLAGASALVDQAGMLRAIPAELRGQLMPVLATASLTGQDGDGGARILARRAATTVEVCGSGEVARLLADLLCRSGVATLITPPGGTWSAESRRPGGQPDLLVLVSGSGARRPARRAFLCPVL